MKTFHCDRCQQHVFFENVKCESCAALLGYVPALAEVCAFEPADEGTWRNLHASANGALYKQCNNYALENVCNWMLPADSPDVLCPACSLTHTIPNLTVPENRVYWYRLETAKRRLLYALGALGLHVESRKENPGGGLQFEFLEDGGVGEKVLTGHDNGLITMNIAEADDAHREKTRMEMGEPYRTLLGHFRHEIGHYYFDRLVTGSKWEEPFRALFGDERTDYQAALQAHYEEGPPADWDASYVSAYATTHPWEDWAETWAHYLHIVDTIDTAANCGLELKPDDKNEPTLTDSSPIESESFDNLMKRWFPLTYALNSLNRSLGLADAYPFTLAPKVIDKLRFVHRVIASADSKQEPMPNQISESEPSGAEATPPKPATTAPDGKNAPAPSDGTAVA
ncbi:MULTISPECIES: putative zinc-binding metallopeptidase [unclassified Caballeronia]|uniref:zinc-binding metallopeptidase family protein n=1 Tax=unclassified Caballeronia TaxID=2646786 RepID=UPI002865E5CB|nr:MULTISPECIES: putative zinc-binding metallopeptidase [unclassified Caballeronia]MDR5752980.1 putative zinc-binding metallopeptidase [Caballeronia sp. LZ024]MDR5841267.1 putative zinc-binding metallopeptidase [Caballeronia sp. LZ031]